MAGPVDITAQIGKMMVKIQDLLQEVSQKNAEIERLRKENRSLKEELAKSAKISS